VSARNGVATLDDLDLVLQRGMPGTSMPSFPGLQPTQRKALCEEVVGFQRAGLREQLLLAARAEGDPADEGEVQQSVDRCTTPGELIRLPATWDAPLGALLSEGRRLYVNLGCHNCHGDGGDGSDSQALFDEQGEPTRARDLVREPFKGGREPQSVYVRIALGMPGTPHPAVPALHADALVALTQYACNLSPAPLRSLTNHERSVLAESRAYLQAIREPHAQ
jgi:hypothetical protein